MKYKPQNNEDEVMQKYPSVSMESSFGQFIKQIRNEIMKLSRERMGMLLGVSKGHVLKWENGSTNMSKSAKYLFFDQLQKHLEKHRLGWNLLSGNWTEWVPEDYKKTRGWTCKSENGDGIIEDSESDCWVPPNIMISDNPELSGSVDSLLYENKAPLVPLKKRTKRTLRHEEVEEKMRKEEQLQKSMMASSETKFLLKKLKSILTQSQIWQDEIQTPRNQVELKMDASDSIGELTRVFTFRLDEKNDVIKAKDDLIQMLRDKINSLEIRIENLTPDLSTSAEEKVVQANKDALGAHCRIMKDQGGEPMDTLKRFEEHYAKEIDSSYKGKIPRFMPEDHTKFDH